ncbi:MAG: hypothetical protein LBL84_02145 [Candidatus Nomurabacteria bacterium]|jgi:hypothetical protein|nr:hypothetical protein [Candidatus Nomurabacteria bacterium]
MDIFLEFSIIGLAALIHASFQLTIGCMILLFHHSFGGKKTRQRTREFVGSYISGAGLTVFLVLSALSFWLAHSFGWQVPAYLLAIEVGLLASLGVILLLFYYRYGKHTELYLPRGLAKFLTKQIRKTSNNHEAFIFGVAGVLGELPFVIIITLVGASSVVALPEPWRPLAVLLYVIVSILPLLVLSLALRSSRTISEVQHWRVRNKNFLKVVAGLGAIVLAAYLATFRLLPLVGA